ncbi:MAG: CHRD domain-containing protein, partial [Verrucomicrobiota bacterium]
MPRTAGFYRIVDMAGNRATPFTVYMTSTAERPTPVNNPAGLGTGTLVLEGNTLTFDIHYSGLTGPAILA